MSFKTVHLTFRTYSIPWMKQMSRWGFWGPYFQCSQTDVSAPWSNDTHRSAFLDSLVHLVDPNRCHFKKRCTGISSLDSSEGGLKLTFADGTEAEADIVLGADGIKSVVRNYVLKDAKISPNGTNIAFTNTIAYRGLVPSSRLQDLQLAETVTTRPMCWLGLDKVCCPLHLTLETCILLEQFLIFYSYSCSTSLLFLSKMEKSSML